MKKKILLFTILTALMMMLMGCVTVSAAQKSIQQIKTGTTYTQYDVTGDKKPDKLYIKRTPYYDSADYEGRYDVYVNGKNVFSEACKFTGSGKAYILKTPSGKCYLFLQILHPYNNMPYSSRVLRYNGKKFVTAANVSGNLESCPVVKITPYKITNNYITFKCDIEPNGIGYSKIDLTYNISGTKLKLKSNTIKFNTFNHKYRGKANIWYARYSFDVFSKVNSSKVAFKVKYGERCKVTHIWLDNSKSPAKWAWVRIENSKGKSGWVSTRGAKVRKLFYETYFVGN